MKKFIFGIIFIAAVLMTVPVRARAEEENRITVSDNILYDPDEHRFVFDMSNVGAGEVKCNISDGVLTNGPVRLESDVITILEVYKDGEKLDSSDLSEITEPGSYVVNAFINGQTIRVMGFTLIEQYTSMESYQLPKNYVVESLTYNGEAIECDPYVVYFDYEGDYVLTLCCGVSHTLYDIFLTIDKTPPVLALSNVKDGVAKGAVSLADREEGSELYIEYNNTEIIPVEELTATGSYFVVNTDAAGNRVEYKFDIVVAVNASTVWFIVIFVLIAAGITVYLLMSRKKMRIR